jgi:hypothetical protein
VRETKFTSEEEVEEYSDGFMCTTAEKETGEGELSDDFMSTMGDGALIIRRVGILGGGFNF